MNTKHILKILIAVVCCLNLGCKKYLEEKQDQQLVVPKTIGDLQSLLEDHSNINQYHPGAGEISCDDYYLTNAEWNGLNEFLRGMYIWHKEKLFKPGSNNDWVNAYNNVYKANVVLFNLDKIVRNNGDEGSWNNLKGSALFIRGIEFAQIAWVWSLAYDKTSGHKEMGIPLRLDPNFNIPSTRSNVQETYDQILSDLKLAAELLPAQPIHVIRPSKPAAFGWLARVYLSMREYDSALYYSNRCLQLYDKLIDYNSITPPTVDPPFSTFNKEVIYHTTLDQPIAPAIDSNLYSSYDSNDLRKEIYFYKLGTNQYGFKGSYDGSNWSGIWFNGIATDEIYLVRAECYARTGDHNAAIKDLNSLMSKRWKNNGSWVPFTATSASEALSKILIERRKELIQRGLRWVDIKRLNKEGANIILKRIINSQEYALLPNDNRFALPIPEDIIATSPIQQNIR